MSINQSQAFGLYSTKPYTGVGLLTGKVLPLIEAYSFGSIQMNGSALCLMALMHTIQLES